MPVPNESPLSLDVVRDARLSHGLLRAIASALSSAVFAKDLEGRYQLCNGVAAAMWGRTPHDIIGLHDADIFGPDIAPILRMTDAQVLDAGDVIEYCMVLDDAVTGETRRYQVCKGPVHDDEGAVTGVFGIAHDVTGRTRAESALQRSRAELQERVKELKTLYGVMQVLAPEHEPIAARLEKVAELLPAGWQYPDITGVRIACDELEHATSRFQPGEWMLECDIISHGVELGRIEVCYREPRPECDHGPFLAEERALLNAVGYHVGEAIRRNRLEQQLVQAQKMKAVARLAGGIAHDFNNLLTGIGGLTHLMLLDTAEDDPRRRDLQEIIASTDRATALTRQLLAFSRKQVVQPAEHDLNELVRGFAEPLDRLLGSAVTLELELSDEPLPVLIDESQLEQTLVNLVMNARDAMADGGAVTIRTDRALLRQADLDSKNLEIEPGEYLRLRCEDTGVGMDEQTLRQAFEPFFTTKPQSEGSGLGLSSAHGAIAQAGGAITMESEPGAGTACEIYLPPAAAGAPSAGQRPAVGDGRKGLVVVVDDEGQIRTFVGRALERDGYEPRLLEDPHDALALVQQDEAVRALVTDVVMPGLSGIDLMERVRAARPELPILLMSGYFEQADQLELEPRTSFLRKPFTPDVLLERLEELLQPGDA